MGIRITNDTGVSIGTKITADGVDLPATSLDVAFRCDDRVIVRVDLSVNEVDVIASKVELVGDCVAAIKRDVMTKVFSVARDHRDNVDHSTVASSDAERLVAVRFVNELLDAFRENLPDETRHLEETDGDRT